MKHINVLIEKLNIPTEIIEAVSAENLPEDFDSKIDNYNNSRIEYYKATPDFKKSSKDRDDATYKGALLKHNKRINEALGLGLTNAQLEEIKSIEDFVELTKTHLTEREKKLMNSSDEQLKKDLEKYKNDYSTAVNKLNETTSQIEKIKEKAENEKNEAIDLYKAESLFHKIVSEDDKLPGTDGQNYTLDLIKKDIFDSYIVKSDGTILAKDGTSAIHPEKQTVISTLQEIYDYKKIKAGLFKRSNAGSGVGGGSGAGGGSGSGISPTVAAKMEELKKARLR